MEREIRETSFFLPERHTDEHNKQSGGSGGRGKLFLSHGSDASAGIGVTFVPALMVNVLASWEIERGRC